MPLITSGIKIEPNSPLCTIAHIAHSLGTSARLETDAERAYRQQAVCFLSIVTAASTRSRRLDYMRLYPRRHLFLITFGYLYVIYSREHTLSPFTLAKIQAILLAIVTAAAAVVAALELSFDSELFFFSRDAAT